MRFAARSICAAAVCVALLAACSSSKPTSSATSAATSASAADVVSTAGAGVGADLSAVKTYPVASRNHVDGTIAYAQSPPVGGDHAAPPGWQNCGSYDQPVANEAAVHSLEHGAVWITYEPALAADAVARLRTFTSGRTHVLVSPYPGLTSPVVLTAWGVQLAVTGADDPRIELFLDTYVEGPQTPEPGAPCSGGVGNPL